MSIPRRRGRVTSEAKRAGEAYCLAYFRQKELPVRIVRPFHFHGPGLKLDDGRIVTELIRMGLEGRPIELKSGGTATRTYGYVLDAAVGALLVLLKGTPGEVYNLGVDAPETSIRELATIIAELFGQAEPVRTGCDPTAAEIQNSPERACPDLSRLRGLGVTPRVRLEDGLRRSIAWFRHVRAEEAVR